MTTKFYSSLLLAFFLLFSSAILLGQQLNDGIYKIEFIKGDDVIRFEVKLQSNNDHIYQLSSIDPMFVFEMHASIYNGQFLGFDADYENGCLLRATLIDSKSLYGDGVWDQLTEDPVFVKFSLKQQKNKSTFSQKDEGKTTTEPSSHVDFEITTGSLTDSRDQQSYKTVTIGGKSWMAENLRFKTIGGCIENVDYPLSKYGYYYNWRAANSACPKGWHLPSAEEWEELIQLLGSAKALKAKDEWKNTSEVSNSSQLSILPAGYFSPSVRGFTEEGEQALFWSSSDYFSQEAYYFLIDQHNDEIEKKNKDKNNALSCRCVKDQ
jgi:uncharacterized protein (TIGR02145 family)